jgi:hypothetical protein
MMGKRNWVAQLSFLEMLEFLGVEIMGRETTINMEGLERKT